MRPSIAGACRQWDSLGRRRNKRRRVCSAENGVGWVIGGISKEDMFSGE